MHLLHTTLLLVALASTLALASKPTQRPTTRVADPKLTVEAREIIDFAKSTPCSEAPNYAAVLTHLKKFICDSRRHDLTDAPAKDPWLTCKFKDPPLAKEFKQVVKAMNGREGADVSSAYFIKKDERLKYDANNKKWGEINSMQGLKRHVADIVVEIGGECFTHIQLVVPSE